MFNLKAFRIVKGLSQKELSELLECDQSYISRMENNKMSVPEEYIMILKAKYGDTVADFMPNQKPSKILNLLGWKTKGEPGYEEIRTQLVGLLEAIRVKTGLSIEDVSQKLYRRRKEIPGALSREEISPNMINFILKNVKKLGINPSELTLLNFPNSKNQNLIPFFDTPEAFLKKSQANSYVQFEIFEDTEAFIKVDTNNLSPYISLGDIVGIREIEVSRIRPSSYCLISFTNEKYSFDFITMGTKNVNSWALCTKKDSLPYIEIDESMIKRIFLITHTIRKEAG